MDDAAVVHDAERVGAGLVDGDAGGLERELRLRDLDRRGGRSAAPAGALVAARSAGCDAEGHEHGHECGRGRGATHTSPYGEPGPSGFPAGPDLATEALCLREVRRMILENGIIRTLDAALPVTRALAVAGPRVAGGVGTHEREPAGPERVD